jgi:lysophospholipase L1-like esterase
MIPSIPFRALAKSLTTTIIFFALAELAIRGAYFVRNAMVDYVPLPYAFGDHYGPLPPWLDSLQILRDDETLIWKSAPNVERRYLDVFSPVWREEDRIALLRRFNPSTPPEFEANPKWDVALNSDGFRGGEMLRDRPASTLRIACVGDSWTFGMPVGEAETYPKRLGEWLRRDDPASRYEVLNFGVLGYSSYQGLQLMRSSVLDFNPDIVVIGFAMNDSEVAGYRDKDVVSTGPRPAFRRLMGTFRAAPQHIETYKLLEYAALVLRFRVMPIGDSLTDHEEGSGAVDYDGLEPWTRVSPHDFAANIREMARLARNRGASVVLLDNELWEGSPYRTLLKNLAAELDAPLVDSLAIINRMRADVETQLETRLALTARDDRAPTTATSGQATVVFRAYRGSVDVAKGLSIVGADPQLGSRAPNTVMMRDDGTGGDQRAGDGVWSLAAALPPGKAVSYIYTNSGTKGEWEGLDVPYVRQVTVPAASDGRPVYLPIETFGRVYLQGDHWHTDATGYDAIARAVADKIVTLR